MAIGSYLTTGPYEQITKAYAYGGYGGSGGAGADAGWDASGVWHNAANGGLSYGGGGASAISTGTTTNSALAFAIGGLGGSGGAPGHNADGSWGSGGGKGSSGGYAQAVATDDNSLLFATATATATGGAGGLSWGVGHVGGAGGLVNSKLGKTYAASGESVAGEAATSIVVQTGGAGGGGTCGAVGGLGGLSTAVNAVLGYTNGGVLTLSQTSTGGAGGNSDSAAGGNGGAAISSLTTSDTSTATINGVATVEQSATVNATVTAVGGGAGLDTATGVGAVAGAATATLVATGAGVVDGATSATGGAGVSVSGIALATTNVTGTSGAYSATANASLYSGSLIQSVSATTAGGVDGASVANADAGIGGAAFKAVTSTQAVALIEGAPNSVSITAALTGNSAISAAFGAAPVYFGIGELGGAHSSALAGGQTVTSSFSETVDLTQLASRQDLVAGFYGAKLVGTGVTGVTFDLYADGVDVVHQVFASATAAKAFFTNDAVDLGSLASGAALGANTLTLTATMSVTTNQTTSGTKLTPAGFYGSIIVGDPPHASSGASSFVQAMAALGGGSGAVALAASTPLNSTAATLALPTHGA